MWVQYLQGGHRLGRERVEIPEGESRLGTGSEMLKEPYLVTDASI